MVHFLIVSHVCLPKFLPDDTCIMIQYVSTRFVSLIVYNIYCCVDNSLPKDLYDFECIVVTF